MRFQIYIYGSVLSVTTILYGIYAGLVITVWTSCDIFWSFSFVLSLSLTEISIITTVIRQSYPDNDGVLLHAPFV